MKLVPRAERPEDPLEEALQDLEDSISLVRMMA